MKSEAEMQTEGRVINRWLDNYTPIHTGQAEAKQQTTLNQGHKQ